MDGKVIAGWKSSFLSFPPNLGNTAQSATLIVIKVEVLHQGLDFCLPICITELLVEHKAAELKTTFPSLLLDVARWLNSGLWEMRSDVCKFGDICLKRRNTKEKQPGALTLLSPPAFGMTQRNEFLSGLSRHICESIMMVAWHIS